MAASGVALLSSDNGWASAAVPGLHIMFILVRVAAVRRLLAMQLESTWLLFWVGQRRLGAEAAVIQSVPLPMTVMERERRQRVSANSFQELSWRTSFGSMVLLS
jgi:hypothetical protein